MIQRCTNPNNDHFEHYGKRGITVCERWTKFENFLADMGERPPGTSIDRIDNDRGYEQANCRWATAIEQARNRRASIGDVATMLMRHARRQGNTIGDIAHAFGFSKATVSRVTLGIRRHKSRTRPYRSLAAEVRR